MTEIEWWDYDTPSEMAQAVAGDIRFIIESAIDARGSAVIALPGGKTPVPVYEVLAEAKLNWRKVTIVPTDDRLVPMGDELSNITMIGKTFVPLGARVFPITSEAAEDYKAAGRAADARLQDLHWPLDLCLLGSGHLDGYVEEGVNLWDHAAAALVARAGGARWELLAGASGRDLLVAAPAASYDAFRDAVLGAGYARSGGPSPRGE